MASRGRLRPHALVEKGRGRSSRCGGLSLHVWVGWVGEIKNGLIAAAWGALYKLTSDLNRGQTQEHAQCTRTRSPAAKISRAKI